MTHAADMSAREVANEHISIFGAMGVVATGTDEFSSLAARVWLALEGMIADGMTFCDPAE